MHFAGNRSIHACSHGDVVHGCAGDAVDGLERLQELQLLRLADARDLVEDRLADMLLPEIPVVGDRETVRLIAKPRQYEKRLRVPWEKKSWQLVVGSW